MVSAAVRDTLRMEGWDVEVCDDGEDALKLLESNAHYDLLGFDYDLPGVGGLELVRHARKLTRRRNVPIIMLSAVSCGREALRAGVNTFLRKPEDILTLAENISRLLVDKTKQQ